MALIYMRPMMIPLIFAIFVYSILTPIERFIQKRLRVPKLVAVILSLLLLVLVLTGIVLVFISSINSFVDAVPKYQQSIDDTLEFIKSQITHYNIQSELGKIQETIEKLPLFSYAKMLTNEILAFVANLLLVFIFTVFMMASETRDNGKNKLVAEIMAKISAYISAKSLLSLSTGLLVWIVLMAFSIELAFIFAVLTIFLNFIPTIGSILAVVLPLPIAFLHYELGWEFWAVFSLTAAIQIVIGNILEPKVLGESMDLHPITVLICLIFWGMVWGLAGMFLAVPITAVIKIVFSRVEATQPLAEILAGRLDPK